MVKHLSLRYQYFRWTSFEQIAARNLEKKLFNV